MQSQNREHLGSRLGFILLSAGCAIGCGNVWKFPWLCGEYGGGLFVLFYLIFLVLLGLPVISVEFSIGRAAQQSPIRMYQKLEKPGTKWHLHGYACLIGPVVMMMFYLVVTGEILYYFVQSAAGVFMDRTAEEIGTVYTAMRASPLTMLGITAVVVIAAMVILSMGIKKGLERVTKPMMILLLVLIIALAVNSMTLSGAREGLRFYLLPDFSELNAGVIVQAMNQAFFSLSLGIGSMAIFGSYIGKERTLTGEGALVIVLDTFVAITAGLIIFPACFTYGVEPGAGSSLLFEAMANTFGHMNNGRLWGSIFFLFMFFAAMSTVLTVVEGTVACLSDLTKWSRRKTCIICCIALLVLMIPCALAPNLLKNVHPLKPGNDISDLCDFIVSTIMLPLGALIMVCFVSSKSGWGWDGYLAEANCGKGIKIPRKARLYFNCVLPLIILVLFIVGLIDYFK